MKFNTKILDEKYVWKIAENKFFQNFYSPPKWLSSFIFIYRFWYFHILYSFRKWNWNEISYSIENFLRVVHRLRFILLRILSGEDISDNLEMRVQIAMIFRRGNYARENSAFPGHRWKIYLAERATLRRCTSLCLSLVPNLT